MTKGLILAIVIIIIVCCLWLLLNRPPPSEVCDYYPCPISWSLGPWTQPEAPGLRCAEVFPPEVFACTHSLDSVTGVSPTGELQGASTRPLLPEFKSIKPNDILNCPKLPKEFTRADVGTAKNWYEFCAQKATYTIQNKSLGRDVLRVKCPASASSGRRPIVCIKLPFQAGGLVVRQGGVVLIDSSESADLKLGFVIVESGGLLQAGMGDSEDSTYRIRYEKPLTLQVITEEHGYQQSIVPCSQFDPQVLTPTHLDIAQVQCYNAPKGGMCLNNAISVKCVASLFNGNIHFAGELPSQKPYRAWSATCASNRRSRATSSMADLREHLTSGAYMPAGRSGAGSVPDAYASVFMALDPNSAQPSSAANDQIKTEEDPSPWRAFIGAYVVITCVTDAWESTGAANRIVEFGSADYGLTSLRGHEVPIAVDGLWDDGRTSVEAKPSRGVDIARIKSIGNDHTITFATALCFDHSCGSSSFDTEAGQAFVETRTHIGLLSRAVTIRGLDMSVQSSTCNLVSSLDGEQPYLRSFGRMNAPTPGMEFAAENGAVPTARAGPGGSIILDRIPVASSGNEMALEGKVSGCTLPVPQQCPLQPLQSFYLQETHSVRDAHGKESTAFSRSFEAFQPPENPVGSHMYSTKDCTASCDCILGATVKAQYGSALVLDGVELRHCGIPGNFGTLGQYSLHWHNVGWSGAWWTDYCEEGAERRVAFINSSNWQSFARGTVIHGTNFAQIQNNVYAVTMGHCIYLEDGVENSNLIDHNLIIATLSASELKEGTTFTNPSKIIGNIGSDNFAVSSIWMTNSQNIVTRNIICCNPGISTAVWLMNQSVESKQGPASFLTGYKDQATLPGITGGKILVDISPSGARTSHVPVVLTKDLEQFGQKTTLGIKRNDKLNHQVQPILLFAENQIYATTAYFWTNEVNDGPLTFQASTLLSSYYETKGLFMPQNGEFTTSNTANNSQPLAYTTAGNSEVGDQPVCLTQNLVFNLAGALQGLSTLKETVSPKLEFGGSFWRHLGGLVLINECHLGGDLVSLSGEAAAPVVLINFITNSNVYGSNSTSGDPLILAGSQTTIGKTACLGRQKLPTAAYRCGILAENAVSSLLYVDGAALPEHMFQDLRQSCPFTDCTTSDPPRVVIWDAYRHKQKSLRNYQLEEKDAASPPDIIRQLKLHSCDEPGQLPIQHLEDVQQIFKEVCGYRG